MNKAIVVSILAFLLIFSCRKKDDFITDADAQLEFSVDTLRFDTVFTTLGSATRIIKIYNTHKKDIQISRISIREGGNSRFRFNVDGDVFSGEATDVEIAANDSLYIFAEVTVNPDQDIIASPFVIHDALQFETNGNNQEVVLEAWGQNANYVPNEFNSGGLAYFSCNLGTEVWDDPKPYVLYGILYVDSCTLVLPEGCRLYIHGGLERTYDEEGNIDYYNDGAMFFFANGKLQVDGTQGNPVIIEGDRLEEDFDDTPAQWAGIRFGQNSKGHTVDHCILKNSLVGFVVDSAAELTLRNTQIYNTAGNGVVGVHADVTGANCLFHSNGGGNVNFFYGGNYQFDYCTFASYGVDASAVSLSNALCLDLLCGEYRSFPLNAQFRNSIIFGSRSDEISLFDRTEEDGDFSYKFENCIVRVDELDDEEGYPDFFSHCDPCINNNLDAILFVDTEEDDYHLDSLSIAEGQAVPLAGVTRDLDGNSRDSGAPDVGCYEYQY